MAKVIRADSRQTRSRLTTAPGTVDFMPPETLEANPVYGTAVLVDNFFILLIKKQNLLRLLEKVSSKRWEQ